MPMVEGISFQTSPIHSTYTAHHNPRMLLSVPTFPISSMMVTALTKLPWLKIHELRSDKAKAGLLWFRNPHQCCFR